MDKSLYQQFFESAPLPFVCFKLLKNAFGQVENGIITAANEPFMQLWKRKPEEVIGKTVLAFFSKEKIESRMWWNELVSALTKQIFFNQIVVDFLPGKPLRIKAFPFSENEAGCILRDVSSEVMLKEELEGFLSVSLELFCIANPQGVLLKVNHEFERVLGYTIEELEGTNFFDLIHPEDIPITKIAMETLAAQNQVRKVTNRYRCKDGTYKTLEWNAVPNGSYFFSTARDVTEYIEKESTLRIAAVTDPLTGLFNRQFLYERIQTEIDKAKETNKPLSMISVDIDHFKYVNDIWGHPIGDEVLERTANMLKLQLRTSDFLARVGGEEFLAIVLNAGVTEAFTIAERMRQVLYDNPHPRVGRVTASFGVAQLELQENFNHWYKRADDAVYLAKEQGRNRTVIAGEPGKETTSNSLYMTWDNSLNSGEHRIDDQHQNLLQVGNKLVFLALSGAEPLKISRQIDELLIHITRHFATEEAILRRYQYSGLKEHMKIHRELEQKTAEIAREYLEKNAHSPIFLSFVINDLIVGHLREEDTKFFYLFQKK